jgi:uncharacterized protein YqjF (DUF2071 family)
MNRRFLTADWRYLVMLNYETPQEILQPFVPAGTELDLWQGRCFVSVVGFRFLDTRVKGIPVPFHRSFDEINLRFYVRHRAEDGWRRGVVFIKEVVPKWAIAAVARWVYNENYVARRTAYEIQPPAGAVPGRAAYSWWEREGAITLSATFEGEPELPGADAEESFIAEHYWGYTRQRDGSTVEYEVRHPPWRVWRATTAKLEGVVEAPYGDAFGEILRGEMSSAFVAEGSPVEVFSGRRLPL